MKLKFETAFRLAIWLLISLCVWSLWAAEQQTNSAPGTTLGPANKGSAFVRAVQRWEQNPLTFKLDQVEVLRDNSFLGEPLWKYLASLIYILLAFYVAKLLDWIARVWLKRVTRTPGKVRELLLGLLRGPIKVVVFVVLLHLGLNLFDWAPLVKLYLSKVLILVVAGSLTYLTIKIVLLLLDLWRQRAAPETDQRFHEQLFSFLQKTLTAFVIIVAVLVTAQNMGINITAVITSLSIGGLAVGLAAQDTLANFFGAIAVLVDKPFRVGDQIKVEANEGIVEAVGLRSTRLRNADGHLIAVPNKTMGNASITNISRRPTIRTSMNFLLPRTFPTAKIKRAVEILREVYGGHPRTEDLSVTFNQFAGANINLLLIHWWKGTDYQEYATAMHDLNFAAQERLEAEQINLA
jgi:MscS family membrane protein